MIRLLLSVFLSLSALANSGGEEGGWISGGGDPLRIYFEEGRMYARELSRNTSLEPDRIVNPEVADWFRINKTFLANDIDSSSHEWSEAEQATCAFTEYRPSAPVKLSFDSCRSVSSAQEASKVLIHESVHHLGVADHAFADKVAVQLVATWEKRKLGRVASCPEETPPMVRNMLGRWRMDPSLGRLLANGFDRPLFSEIELQEDRSFLSQFDSFREFHGGCALSAGVIRWKPLGQGVERSVPFFVRRNGLQLFLVTFRSEEDIGLKKLSARPIQLVRSSKREKDRLVILAHPPGPGPRRAPGRGAEIEAFERLF